MIKIVKMAGPFLLLFLGVSAQATNDPFHSVDLRPLFQQILVANPEYKIIKQETVKSSARCHEQAITLQAADPLTQKPQAISLLRYTPIGQTISTTEFLIHPPTKVPSGGASVLDRWYANELCHSGVRTTIMQGWDGYYEQGVDDFGFHDRAAIRAVFVSRVALEYIDAPVYIMGTSLGSLYSSMLLGTQSAIKGGVLIVGGAPLSEILETTDEKQLKQLREERMQHYKIKSVAEYEKILTENVRISPENFIDLTKTKTLEMVLAERDTTVPTATQRKLWSAWGKPHLKAFQHDHVPTVVWSFIKDRQKIKSFLLHGIRSNNEK